MPDIDPQLPAELYDTALRFLVPSESDPHVKYLVELDSYGGNGMCNCQHFQMRLEPELRRGNPEKKILRCKHIGNARDELATVVIRSLVAAERKCRG